MEETEQNEEEFEDIEVDVLEFSLDEDEIEELIEKLIKLKEEKTSFDFDINEENQLIINYEESEDD